VPTNAPYSWQQSLWNTFSQQVEQQKVPHAALLTGAEGLGQEALANQIIATLLCTDTQSIDACNQCHSCQLFTARNHPDHTFVQPEETGKQIKIEQIRRLKEKQTLTPTVSKWKTVLISPAESMNINATNSLLKLLEEPQNNTLLILISAKPERLPITILSRCQKMVLFSPTPDIAIDWLKQQGGMELETVESLLPLVKGAPLAVLSLKESDLIQQLNQANKDFKLLLQGQVNPVTLAKEWLNYDLLILFNYLQSRLKQRIIICHSTSDRDLLLQYWSIYDCIMKTIKLLSSSNNLSTILLIEQFIVSVMNTRTNKGL